MTLKLALCSVMLITWMPLANLAQTTAFTYQGNLTDNMVSLMEPTDNGERLAKILLPAPGRALTTTVMAPHSREFGTPSSDDTPASKIRSGRETQQCSLHVRVGPHHSGNQKVNERGEQLD